MPSTSTRLAVAAMCVFVAPFFTLIPGVAGIVSALGLVLLAWCLGTNTTIELALVVLFLEGVVTRAPPYDGVWVGAFGAAIGITMLLSVCLGLIRPVRVFRFFQRGLRRLFSPPGTGGTIHAGWFALGFWFVFLIIVARPAHYSEAGYLKGWLIAFLLMWAVRWFVPQREPAALLRVSLFVCAQSLLYYATPPCLVTFYFSDLAPYVAAAMTLPVLWGLHRHWNEWRIRSGRHPRWVFAERHAGRRLIRERVDAAGYRGSTQGMIVGSLPFTPSLAREAKVALGFTCVFQVLNFVSWLS